MNYSPLVAACAIFLLIAQTVAFGIWHRTCEFGLDFAPQIRHNTRIVNNSGIPDAPRYCNSTSHSDDDRRQCN